MTIIILILLINQLMLPDGVGQQPVDVTIRWVGPKLNAVAPVSGMLATILTYTLFILIPVH